MASEIVMPRMGLTMETGIIVQWLKQEGELVTAGEPLLEIETDKATVEIEALEGGTLQKIIAVAGEEVPVGAVIAYLQEPGEAAKQPASAVSAAAITSAQTAVGPVADLRPTTSMTAMSQKVRASPAARRLAKDLGVALADVRGSGPNGRIVAWNVEDSSKVAASTMTTGLKPALRISPVAQRMAADKGLDLSGVQGSGPAGTITRRDVELAVQRPAKQHTPEVEAVEPASIAPVTRIQRVMAERMTQSFTTAPHFYLHTEVDARQLMALRQQLLPRFEQSERIHLTVTDLLIYFCSRVLPRHPLLMAQWAQEGLRHFHQVHIGLAVEVENGLLVPVIRDVDQLGLVEIARRRTDLAERARQGKLLPGEFEQGVFTISNLGMYRIDAFDAILNPPQAAILAVGRVKERALVENGQVIAASMLNLSLSVDHRVLDGAHGARFLSELAEMIEAPGLSMR